MQIVDRKTKKERTLHYSNGVKFLYNTILGRVILKLLTNKFVANVANKYLSSPTSKKRIIKTIVDNNIDMSQFEEKDFQSFNEFFLRRKKSLNFDMHKNHFISPCDAKLLVYKLNKNASFDVKGSYYNVNDIVDEGVLSGYENGYALVFRLEVSDYHHFHFIDNGTLDKYHFIKGCLHTVQPIAMKKYKVFHTNSREYTILHTENFGDVVEVEVGALIVGKIVNEKVKKYKRGDEKGHFEFGGSTIILFVKDNEIIIDNDILLNSTFGKETTVICGERIGIKYQ